MLKFSAHLQKRLAAVVAAMIFMLGSTVPAFACVCPGCDNAPVIERTEPTPQPASCCTRQAPTQESVVGASQCLDCDCCSGSNQTAHHVKRLCVQTDQGLLVVAPPPSQSYAYPPEVLKSVDPAPVPLPPARPPSLPTHRLICLSLT